MDAVVSATGYRPMTLVELAGHLLHADPAEYWRLVVEFLNEYAHEPVAVRRDLLRDEPPSTGIERWDVFLAGLAEHLTVKDDVGAPAWTRSRSLEQFWFPFDSPAARADAVVHGPASFRRRGIFVAPEELEIA